MGLLQAITSPTAVGAEAAFPCLSTSKERRKDPRDSSSSRKQPQVVREGLPVVGEEVELEGEEILASSMISGTQQEVSVFMLVRENVLFFMNVYMYTSIFSQKSFTFSVYAIIPVVRKPQREAK